MKKIESDPRADEFDRFLQQCTEDGIPEWLFLERYHKLQQEMKEIDKQLIKTKKDEET